MSLKRSAQKTHLESEYTRYRNHAEAAREEGNTTKAARYYRQCVGVLEDLAELEPNDRLATERKELAANLATAAERLETDTQVVATDSDAVETGSAGGGSPGESAEEVSTLRRFSKHHRRWISAMWAG